MPLIHNIGGFVYNAIRHRIIDIRHAKKERRFGKTYDTRQDFSKWKYYDEFWKEKGEEAYTNYVERVKTEKQ